VGVDDWIVIGFVLFVPISYVLAEWAANRRIK